jgi:hypothetical protein
MIGTSSTRAGRISESLRLVILLLILHHTRTDATGAPYTVIINFFRKKKQIDSLDIPFTAQLASRHPLAGHEKADSAFHYGAPNSRRVLRAFAS